MISFDIINSIFKCWFWSKFCCFKAVVDTKGIKIFFKGCDSLWIIGSRGEMFQMIIFDLINSIFKCWFWFEFCCFKAVFDTIRIKILLKGCDSCFICGSGGNTFQMIIFDLIISLFNFWIRFEFFYLRSVVHTKLIIIIFKRCRNYINK